MVSNGPVGKHIPVDKSLWYFSNHLTKNAIGDCGRLLRNFTLFESAPSQIQYGQVQPPPAMNQICHKKLASNACEILGKNRGLATVV